MRYVIALGGNALEKKNAAVVARTVCGLHSRGHSIVITHGNGPQVGELYLKEGRSLSLLTEETQDSIGREIRKAILENCSMADVEIVRTRTLVSMRDREFSDPSKPIGKFYHYEADVPRGRKKFEVKKLENGFRIVVPSPAPLRIFELNKIMILLEKGNIVIAAGGGGAAMIISKGRRRRADAVIDKDMTSALLAEKVNADGFFILTNVDGAYLNFEKRGKGPIRRMKTPKAREYASLGCFEKGSMLPKVNACIDFAEKTGRRAAIGNIEKAEAVLKYKSATIVAP